MKQTPFVFRIVTVLFLFASLNPCTTANEAPKISAGIIKDFAERLKYVGVAVAEDDHFVWGSSPVIGPEGDVHLFVARWPSQTRGGGWRTDCEIARYVADGPEGPFFFVEVVVQDEKGQLSPHNPTIRKLAGKYVLLYIANDGVERHPANQKIYMRIADSPKGPWRKVGRDGLVLDVPQDKDNWCYGSRVGVNNPSIIRHPDGRYFLYYKALPKDGGARRFGVATSDTLEGPYAHYPVSVTDNYSQHKTIEDGYAFIFSNRFYILSRNRKQCVMPGYDGVLWESDDGFSFKAHPGYRPAMHYFPKDVKAKARAIWRRGELERPQLLITDGRPAYLYAAAGLSISEKNNSTSFVYRVMEGD
jgi:hypothetical protein